MGPRQRSQWTPRQAYVPLLCMVSCSIPRPAPLWVLFQPTLLVAQNVCIYIWRCCDVHIHLHHVRIIKYIYIVNQVYKKETVHYRLNSFLELSNETNNAHTIISPYQCIKGDIITLIVYKKWSMFIYIEPYLHKIDDYL